MKKEYNISKVMILFISIAFLFSSSCQKSDPIPTISGISITTAPLKVNYYIGENLELSGLVLTVLLDNGSEENIAFANFESKGIVCYPPNESKLSAEYSEVVIKDTLSMVSVSQPITYFTLTDIDANNYSIVKIGEQVWMAQNLRTTTYNDGSPITLVESDWDNLTTGAYCWFNNDESTYGTEYGAFYNWYTLTNENLCPAGWHIPSDADWKTLEGYVDSQFNIGDIEWDKEGGRGFDAGMKLKSSSGWDTYSNSINGTNDYGFDAVPSGYHAKCGGCFVDAICQFWSYNSGEYDLAWRRTLYHNENIMLRNTTSKNNGYSVRCIKNSD